MGAIGFWDDYLKLKQKLAGKKNTGLVESYKLAGQVTLGFAVGYYIWKHPLSNLPGASTTLPFYKYILIVPLTAGLGWLYVLFVTFVMTGASNAVNITDGLDGLAAGLTAIAALTFAFYAYVVGRVDASQYLHVYFLRGSGELTVFCAALMGACIGARFAGLDGRRARDAIGIALAQPPYPLAPAFFGPDSKATMVSEPLVAGLRAATLAAEGLTGPADILGDDAGLLNKIGARPLPFTFGALGSSWVTESLAYKIYPGCAYIDTPVDEQEAILAFCHRALEALG